MFEVGQKVWDVVRGEGVVYAIESETPYPVVVKFSDGGKGTYMVDGKSNVNNKNPSLYPYPVETIKKVTKPSIRKVTKPSINWDHVHENYMFLSRDADGRAWLYMEEPMAGGSCWNTAGSVYARANSYASFSPGTCDWKDSLVVRPEGA